MARDFGGVHLQTFGTSDLVAELLQNFLDALIGALGSVDRCLQVSTCRNIVMAADHFVEASDLSIEVANAGCQSSMCSLIELHFIKSVVHDLQTTLIELPFLVNLLHRALQIGEFVNHKKSRRGLG